MMSGETIRSGAPRTCPTCEYTPKVEVLLSGGGFYIGTFCKCGPYTRESEYYSSFDQAQGALDAGCVSWRTPEYRVVNISAQIKLRDGIPIDEILGDHTINCILSNNCDGYENCEPVIMNIYHSRYDD